MMCLKAIIAGLVAAGGTFAAPSLDGSFHYWQIAAGLVAGLTAFNATYFTPNKAAT